LEEVANEKKEKEKEEKAQAKAKAAAVARAKKENGGTGVFFSFIVLSSLSFLSSTSFLVLFFVSF